MKKYINNKKLIFIILTIIVFVFLSIIFLFIYKNELNKYNKFKNKNSNFENEVSKIKAKSFIIMDMNKKIIYGKDINTDYSLASLSKIFLSYTIMDNLEKFNPYEQKEIKKRIMSMMRNSDNDEAYALSLILNDLYKDENYTLNYMNNIGEKYNINFENVTGLDINNHVSGVGNAQNIAYAFIDIYKKYPIIFDRTTDMNDNTNIIVKDLDLFVGGKTGFTKQTGGNLGIIIQKGLTEKYLILTLASNKDDRFTDTYIIYKALLELQS